MPPRPWNVLLPALVCAIVTAAVTCWPGDVPWGGDDVTLIAAATRANAAHRLASSGLTGTFGIAYGPVPTQAYQLLLCVTHDLPTVVRLRAGLFTAVTSAALLWLTRSLGWSPWLAPLPLLSPFFWFYARLLWDNPFAMPVGAVLVAGYAAHLRGRRGLTVAAAAAAVLPLVHPMTLPLVAAFAGHAIWRRRPHLARRWKRLLVTAAVLAVSSGPYAVGVARTVHLPGPAPASTDGYTPLSRPAAMAYPLLAGRLLSGFRFFDDRGPERGWETTPLGTVARATSAVAFPLVWLGMAVLVRRRAPTVPLLCVVALGFQAVMDGLLRVSPYPHYFTGTWVAAVVCLWAGLRGLGRWSVPVGLVYAVASIISTASFAADIHRTSGGAVWHGPTLAAQQRAPGFHPGLR